MMKVTPAQREAIIKERLEIGKDNPTWSQTEDNYIYAVKIEDDFMTLYIFAPSGNRYKETREFSDNGWDITEWNEED